MNFKQLLPRASLLMAATGTNTGNGTFTSVRYTLVVPRNDQRLVIEGVENLTHEFIHALQPANHNELSRAH